MEINRNNYEEYFLLYADNELTDYEKGEVLKFIRENKDLEDEFKMIHDTICKPDNDINLENKSFLFRQNETSFITEKNYEEIFVLYHDNELTTDQKNKTDLFLNQHPEFEKEFEFFNKAKLYPDNSITFDDKQDLYKKEKAGRVVPIIFWRALAAAVFIGFGIWIMQEYYQPQNVQQPVAVKVKPTDKKLIEPKTTPLSSDKKQENVALVGKSKGNSLTDEKNAKPATALTNQLKKVSKENVKDNKDIASTSLVNSIIKGNKAETKKPAINIPEQKTNSDVAVSADNINSIPKIPSAEKTFTGDIEQKPLRTDNDQPAVQAHTASYVNDARDKNENYVFYNITTEEFRKSKVGGFLKKVKRIVERNNPITHLFSGDDKQVVSN